MSDLVLLTPAQLAETEYLLELRQRVVELLYAGPLFTSPSSSHSANTRINSIIEPEPLSLDLMLSLDGLLLIRPTFKFELMRLRIEQVNFLSCSLTS